MPNKSVHTLAPCLAFGMAYVVWQGYAQICKAWKGLQAKHITMPKEKACVATPLPCKVSRGKHAKQVGVT